MARLQNDCGLRVLPPVSPVGFGCEDWPLGDGGPPTGVTRRRSRINFTYGESGQ